jgi:hypothetical protein
MSELAFDEDGEHFQLPAAVARWRTRRFNNPGKPGGAQVVYGPDSLPLFLDVDATAEEFREAVGAQPGRYRLDGVDAQGRVVGGVPPAYLMINGPAGAASASGGYGGGYSAPPPANTAAEYAMVELARANGDSLRAVADKFGGICDALANVVRAVDGAGLPRRAALGPLLVDHVDQGDDEQGQDERNAAAPPAAQPTFVTVMGQMMQMVQMFVQMTGGATPAKLGAAIGQVVETARVVEAVATTTSGPAASPAVNEPTNEGHDDTCAAASHGTRVVNGTHVTNGAPREPARTRPSSPGAGRMPPAGAPGMSSASASATSASPAADPMAQFQQIMAALTPEEQAQVQYVMTTLSVRDLMQWYEQLAGMSVTDGVAKIRGELARAPMVPTEHAA